jgi:hypothetical protein
MQTPHQTFALGDLHFTWCPATAVRLTARADREAKATDGAITTRIRNSNAPLTQNGLVLEFYRSRLHLFLRPSEEGALGEM